MSDRSYLEDVETSLRETTLPSITNFANGLFASACPGVAPKLVIVVVPEDAHDGLPIVVGEIDRAALLADLESTIATVIEANAEHAQFQPTPPRTDALTDIFRERASTLSLGDDAWVASRALYRAGIDIVALVGISRTELRSVTTPDVPEGVPTFVGALQATFADAVVREIDQSESFAHYFAPSEAVDDLLRRAGERFMNNVLVALEGHGLAMFGTNGFERINRIASLAYEGAEGDGALVFGRVDETALSRVLTFKRRVPLGEPVWARKMLEMSTEKLALVADHRELHGLVERHHSIAGRFWVEFRGRQTWNLRYDSTLMMQTRLGVPTMPAQQLSRPELVTLLTRVFEGRPIDCDAIWSLFETARKAHAHGSLLIVSADPAREAKRLAGNATTITPVTLDEHMVAAVTKIDGAVLVGTDGVCHAVGVILDGEALVPGTPARGARFNSALRYVTWGSVPSVALVLSEDGHVNLLPRLRPRISRAKLSALIELAQKTTGADAQAARRQLATDYAEHVPPDVWTKIIAADRFLSLSAPEQQTRFDRHSSDIIE